MWGVTRGYLRDSERIALAILPTPTRSRVSRTQRSPPRDRAAILVSDPATALRGGSDNKDSQALEPTFAHALQGCFSKLRRHRTGLLVGSVAVMAGFAITAVAVAPLAPDAALLPKRVITETVVPEGLDSQIAALAGQTMVLDRSDVTRGTDTVARLFARLGVADPAAAAFIGSDATARLLMAGRSGKMVQVRTDADGTLQSLVARYPVADDQLATSEFNRLSITRVAGRLQARLEVAPLGSEVRLASGTIRSSLFAATDESGLSDAVAGQIAEIFSNDIDFRRGLRRGDTFSIVYQTLTADGQPVAWGDATGRVLAAEFVNDGQAYNAIWFQPGQGRGAYFDAQGRSKRHAFLAAPLAFSRITSGFAMRFHPILKAWRKHEGIDYAAPIGTPVRAVGDGQVEFAGQQNGYGNVVILRHSNNRSTLYAHLSRIDVHRGERVEQGERIGAVGMTGWATGPHLHFEFRIGATHVDPLKVARASQVVPLDPASRPRFLKVAQQARAELALADSMLARPPAGS
ncbi:MAG: M23 family metallopeptidase [Burkholderiales bacterium]|nr:M23 family metallopeptidase [Burkholderiales bacterium]